MSNELREKLCEFKHCTEELIEAVEEDKIEEIDELFVKRQIIINSIETIEYSKEEFREICIEMNILGISQRLGEVIDKKKSELRTNINSSRVNQAANKSYMKNSTTIKNIFNTRI